MNQMIACTYYKGVQPILPSTRSEQILGTIKSGRHLAAPTSTSASCRHYAAHTATPANAQPRQQLGNGHQHASNSNKSCSPCMLCLVTKIDASTRAVVRLKALFRREKPQQNRFWCTGITRISMLLPHSPLPPPPPPMQRQTRLHSSS